MASSELTSSELAISKLVDSNLHAQLWARLIVFLCVRG